MFKKILKWTSIVLGGLIAALLIANAVFVWRSSVALESRLQAIRDAGDPVAFSDLARKPIPPEDNAATFLRRAEKDLGAIDKDLAAFYASDAYKNDQLGPAEVQTLADVLDAHPEAASLIERAVACPDYDPQLDYSVGSQEFLVAKLDRFGFLKAAARLLDHRTTVLLAHEKRDQAAQSAIAILRLARHYDNEPMLVSYLVAMACRGIGHNATNRVLRSGPVSDSVRDALDAELAQHDMAASFARALKSERAYGILAFNDLNLGRFWPARGFWNNALLYYLDVMNEQMMLTKSHAAFRQIVPSSVPRPASPWLVLTDLVRPAIQAARDATQRTIAMQRCLRILNSVTRLEQRGAQVTGLANLKLPVEETSDPFTGKPLLMNRLPAGWVIYSVGRDSKDDGGQLDKFLDVGLGPVPAPPSFK